MRFTIWGIEPGTSAISGLGFTALDHRNTTETVNWNLNVTNNGNIKWNFCGVFCFSILSLWCKMYFKNICETFLYCEVTVWIMEKQSYEKYLIYNVMGARCLWQAQMWNTSCRIPVEALRPLLLNAHQCKGHKTCLYVPLNSSDAVVGVSSYLRHSIYDVVFITRLMYFTFVRNTSMEELSFLITVITAFGFVRDCVRLYKNFHNNTRIKCIFFLVQCVYVFGKKHYSFLSTGSKLCPTFVINVWLDITFIQIVLLNRA